MKTLAMRTNAVGITYCPNPSDAALLMLTDDERALELEPFTDYVVVMLPMPRGYRLATAEDRKHPKPVGTKVLYDNNQLDDAVMASPWVPEATYFVPVDYEPGSVEVQVLGRTKVITRQCARKLGLID